MDEERIRLKVHCASHPSDQPTNHKRQPSTDDRRRMLLTSHPPTHMATTNHHHDNDFQQRRQDRRPERNLQWFCSVQERLLYTGMPIRTHPSRSMECSPWCDHVVFVFVCVSGQTDSPAEPKKPKDRPVKRRAKNECGMKNSINNKASCVSEAPPKKPQKLRAKVR